MLKSSRNRGISRPGVLFLLAILGSIVYAGYNIIPFHYNYHEFVGHMHAQARVADVHSEKEIREFLMSQIIDLNIPIENDHDLEVSKNSNYIYMYHSYTEEFWISLGGKDYLIWEFPFVAEVEEQY